MRANCTFVAFSASAVRHQNSNLFQSSTGTIDASYLNFVSSDNDIKQNNRNNGIADDTGNRRELVHLHGTYT